MKKIIIFVLAVAVIAAGLTIAKRKGKVQLYDEIRPERGPISVDFRETGSVSPRNRLEIKPPISGRIEDIAVVEGQKVKKGEIIALLSSSERAAMLDAARSKGEAELKKWEDIYRPTPITAPLDGFIIARNKEPGQTVSVNDILLVMADKLIIEADVDETDLRYINIGQKVKITLDAYPDERFDGIVEHIAYESQVINNVTVYTLKIRPQSVPENFRAGMTATVEVESQKKENALLLPFEAVTDKGRAKTVLLKTQKGKPETRKIETGITNGKQFEILSGISEDDIVLMPRNNTRTKKETRRGFGGIPGMGGRH